MAVVAPTCSDEVSYLVSAVVGLYTSETSNLTRLYAVKSRMELDRHWLSFAYGYIQTLTHNGQDKTERNEALYSERSIHMPLGMFRNSHNAHAIKCSRRGLSLLLTARKSRFS